jgi:hypothetical protein
MQTLTEWSTSRPGLVGWYVASTERDINARRYWCGRRWSAPVHWDDIARPRPTRASPMATGHAAHRRASIVATASSGVAWSHRSRCCTRAERTPPHARAGRSPRALSRPAVASVIAAARRYLGAPA